MDKRGLQTYSTWAKENLENQIEVSLKALGINDENNIKQAQKVGDVTTIEGDPTSYPADLFGKRERIIDLVKSGGAGNAFASIPVWQCIFAFVLTFLVAMLSLKITLKLLKNNKFIFFSIYLFLLGIGVIIFNFV